MTVKKKTITQMMLEEHHCMKRDRRTLDREFTKVITDDNFHDWKMKFLWRLRDYRFHLAKHIDMEEDGGYMRDIIEEAPEHEGHVNTLHLEHEKLVHQLDDLIDELKPLEHAEKSVLDGIEIHLKDLLKALDNHAANENKLIYDVHFQDYGFSSS